MAKHVLEDDEMLKKGLAGKGLIMPIVDTLGSLTADTIRGSISIK